jgi:hypothetical protein
VPTPCCLTARPIRGCPSGKTCCSIRSSTHEGRKRRSVEALKHRGVRGVEGSVELPAAAAREKLPVCQSVRSTSYGTKYQCGSLACATSTATPPCATATPLQASDLKSHPLTTVGVCG